MRNEDKVILEEYKKTFKSYYKNKQVVELDERAGIRFDWILIRLDDVVPALGPSTPPFRHSKFTLIYVSKGSGEKVIGSVNVPIKARTLMIVPARTITSAMYSEKIKGYHLSFNLDFFLQEHFPRNHLLQLNIFKQNVTPFAYPTAATGKLLNHIFEVLVDEQAHHRKNKNELIALKILELMIVCDRLLKIETGKEKNHNQPLMVQYVNLIQEHYKKQHSTSYYAKKLHVHPNSLNAVTKRYLGQSAKSVIDAKLVNEAKHLLHHTTLTIKEIAYDLGFQSPANFFRFFKRHSDNSPVGYRQKYLNM